MTNGDLQPLAHVDRDTWGGLNEAKDAPVTLKSHGVLCVGAMCFKYPQG